ncbi:hypothetical protein ACWIGW_45970 [Nocardia brasiliensis]
METILCRVLPPYLIYDSTRGEHVGAGAQVLGVMNLVTTWANNGWVEILADQSARSRTSPTMTDPEVEITLADPPKRPTTPATRKRRPRAGTINPGALSPDYT